MTNYTNINYTVIYLSREVKLIFFIFAVMLMRRLRIRLDKAAAALQP